MSRIDDLNKQKRIERWRIRTGNMTWKGTHKDSKTLEAEKRMRRKPYENIHENSLDGSNA